MVPGADRVTPSMVSTIFAFHIMYEVWKGVTEIGTMRATYPPSFVGFFIFLGFPCNTYWYSAPAKLAH